MKTKLVYVLTCAPEAYYIEQALMSIYSARHWNPDAHIVLITDDLTDSLLYGKRGNIQNLISEKVVVPFEGNESMMYRSRWIKTSVRNLIDGDYLFIDCDTIVQRSLLPVDSFSFSVGAVPESLLDVDEFCESLYEYTKEKTAAIGVDLDKEKIYYNSGVMYVKDTENTHQLYELWHSYWLDSVTLGISIDQPALSKANREMGHIIERLPDYYNCMLWTRTSITSDATILHISSYRNPSLLFSEKILQYVQDHGVNNSWLVSAILNPCSTFLPFDFNVVHSNKKQRTKWINDISAFLKGYGRHVDSSFTEFPMPSRFKKLIVWGLRIGLIRPSLFIWICWKRIHLFVKGTNVTDNVCRR